MALDFGTSLDHSPLSENLRGLGGAKVLDFEDQDRVAATVVIPRSQTLLEVGMFCRIFLGGMWDPVFAAGFAKTGVRTWFFGDEVVVDCW